MFGNTLKISLDEELAVGEREEEGHHGRLAFGRRVEGVGVGFEDEDFGVWGLGFGVWGLGFGVWGLGFGVWCSGFRV